LAQTIGNNIFNYNSDDSVTIDIINSAKIIRYPRNEELSVEVLSFGGGMMNYKVEDVENAKTKASILASDIEILTGDIFTGSLDIAQQYTLMNLQSPEVIFDKKTLDLPMKVELTIDNSDGGIVTGNPLNIFKGQMVSLNAIPYEGYRFVGWYKDGEKISEDAYLSFMVLNDMNIKAEFAVEEELCKTNHVEYIICGIPSTCISTGLTEGKMCVICKSNLVEQMEIPINRLNHIGSREVRNSKNSTCTENGYTGDTYCLDCNVIIDSGTVVEKLDHELNTIITNPTCENVGYTTYFCSVCDYSYTANEKEKLPHDMGAYVVTKQASCIEKGTEKSTCSQCGYYTEKIIDKTQHNYQDGVCKVCHKTKVENCSHMCHKKGFMGFIWKIVRFFWKLFKMNPVCDCEVRHY
jgi:hypothetical protein